MTSRKTRQSRDDGGDDAGGSDEDSELFRRLVGDAKRLKSDTAPPHPRRLPARAQFARRDRDEMRRESVASNAPDDDADGEELQRYRHPSVARTTMRRLARGGLPIQAEIDLHGLNESAARAELQRFIADCASRGYRCVRVVHGKGHRSGRAGPVLKRMVGHCLRRLPPVLAFAPTRAEHGGSGATYVLLRHAP